MSVLLSVLNTFYLLINFLKICRNYCLCPSFPYHNHNLSLNAKEVEHLLIRIIVSLASSCAEYNGRQFLIYTQAQPTAQVLLEQNGTQVLNIPLHHCFLASYKRRRWFSAFTICKHDVACHHLALCSGHPLWGFSQWNRIELE
jgi:hypothetical protein